MVLVLEQVSKMKEKVCKECDFHNVGYEGKIWCNLAHIFVKKLGRFCPKKHDIEEVKRKCGWHLPPEKTDDGKSYCLAHLAEGRIPFCKIGKLEDLVGDPDFRFTKSEF